MKTIKRIFPVIILLASFSCANNDEITEAEKQTITMEIENRLSGYPEALKNKDMEWYKDFWSAGEEADFVFAADGTIQSDYKAFAQGLEGVLTNLEEVLNFEFSNSHIHIMGKDAASFVTNFDWGMVYISGDTISAKGSWLYVFRKRDGQWRVVHSAGTHIYY